jgi:hypothetical protein
MRSVTPVIAVANTTEEDPGYCFKTDGEEVVVEGLPGYLKSHPSLVNRNNSDDSTQYEQEDKNPDQKENQNPDQKENKNPDQKENQNPNETVISLSPLISSEKESPLRRASLLTPENLVELGNLLEEMNKIAKN